MSEVEKLRQRVCEEILAFGNSKQEEPDLTLTLDRIITAIDLAGYLPVEPAQLEVLGDEESKEAVEKEWRVEFNEPMPSEAVRKTISQATIAHNEKEQLYRRIK